MNKLEIQAKIVEHNNHIAWLEQLLIDIDESIENNQYSTHEDARSTITNQIYAIAEAQCEGMRNCGNPDFTRLYKVTGVDGTFQATVAFQYNRHDKTYYYIDETHYSYIKIQGETNE